MSIVHFALTFFPEESVYFANSSFHTDYFRQEVSVVREKRISHLLSQEKSRRISQKAVITLTLSEKKSAYLSKSMICADSLRKIVSVIR